MVIEQPTGGLGAVNDMWFQWVIDIGFPGPDRGLGGKYLIVGPGYNGPLPEGGYFIAHSKTNHVLYALRTFIENGNDPKPAADNVKANLKFYRYSPGSWGTSIAEALKGQVKLAGEPTIPEMKFIEATGKSFNTIPPSDFGFFDMINENVQNEPATSYDIELAGQLAAIGIVKGKEFKPDERLKKILTEAAAVGNANGRALTWRYAVSHPEMVLISRIDPSRQHAVAGRRPLRNAAAAFRGRHVQAVSRHWSKDPRFPDGILLRLYAELAGDGYAYPRGRLAVPDGLPRQPGRPVFDGAKTYKVTLQKDIPAAKFWSFTLYDNQTRSMLQTPQKYPRAGSQTYPSPAAEAAADGSITLWFGPQQPAGVGRGNWVQTMPGKGWFTIFRFYSPLQPFFTKEWKPGEIELVK